MSEANQVSDASITKGSPATAAPPNDNQVPEINREEILKQIFGDVGDLIDDFSCAVESTVLLHGRMYITTKYICFYSNLFGLEKKIRIPYSHIKSITKENTAMVIPNAVAINTDKRDYTFRSFWDRDECFRILVTFLEKFRANGKLEVSHPRTQSDAPFPEKDQAKAGSEAEIAAAPPSTASVRLTPPPDTASKRMSTQVSGRPVSMIIDTTTLTNNNDDVIDSESGPRENRVGSTQIDTTTLFNQESTKAKLKIAVISGTMDVSLKDFMALFVDETAPFSYKKYHETVKDTNLVASPWEEIPGASSFGREIKFFKPVNLPGLASTRGVKIQKYRKFGDYGLLLWSSTRLEDVPAADTFSVDDVLAVNVLSDKSINVEITFQVTFLKSTYMKYIIETSTNTEMKKWLETFFNHLKRTTDMFKEGKISLDNPGAALAEIAPPVEEVKPVENTGTTTKKHAEHSDTLFGLLFNFNNETLGDRIKAIVFIFLIAFFIYHYFYTRSVNQKLIAYEQKMKILEELLNETLRKLQN